MENNNIKEDKYKDVFFQDTLKSNSFIEKAPKEFTNKTMDLIMRDWIANPVVEKKNKHSTRYWVILFSSLSMATLIYLATDLRKLINMSDINWLKNFDSTYLTQINHLYNYIVKSISEITPLFFIIVLAILALVIIDKLIKKIPRYSNIYFL